MDTLDVLDEASMSEGLDIWQSSPSSASIAESVSGLSGSLGVGDVGPSGVNHTRVYSKTARLSSASMQDSARSHLCLCSSMMNGKCLQAHTGAQC